MSAPKEYRAAVVRRVSRLYFPVTLADPYYPLAPGSAGGEALFELDDERDAYLAAKNAVLQRERRGPLRLHEIASEATIMQAEMFIRAQLCEADPLRFDSERLARLGLDAMMLEIQEDLAVMSRPAGFAPERARAHYLHVSFPSHWSPSRMLGKNFLSLHARVPPEVGFERAERAQHAAALFSEPAVRFVWSLTPDARLDHHPDSSRAVDWNTTSEACLRVERQVILPLPAAANETLVALFFIRTYIYPASRLSEIQRVALANAIARMSEPVRRYKGIFGHEGTITELLRAASGRAAQASKPDAV